MRNESAADFLELLKEWEKLCKRYKVNDAERKVSLRPKRTEEEKTQVKSLADDIPPNEYEVARVVDICYGDPSETGKRGLYFKVRDLMPTCPICICEAFYASRFTFVAKYAFSWGTLEVFKNPVDCLHVFFARGKHILTDNADSEGFVKSSLGKIDELPY